MDNTPNTENNAEQQRLHHNRIREGVQETKADNGQQKLVRVGRMDMISG